MKGSIGFPMQFSHRTNAAKSNSKHTQSRRVVGWAINLHVDVLVSRHIRMHTHTHTYLCVQSNNSMPPPPAAAAGMRTSSIQRASKQQSKNEIAACTTKVYMANAHFRQVSWNFFPTLAVVGLFFVVVLLLASSFIASFWLLHLTTPLVLTSLSYWFYRFPTKSAFLFHLSLSPLPLIAV
jgi:hypothetical protein